MNHAPIALFIYKRAEHLKKVIDSLKRCDGFYESEVYIFADGPCGESDVIDVMGAREVSKSLLGSHAHYIENEKNMGLANSIIHGVSELCEKYDNVIVLEDDLIVSNKFLTYMNDALNKYRNEKRIMQISGYMYPVSKFIHRQEALFLPYTTSWGWATWARAWKLFDPNANGSNVLDTDKVMRKKFNMGGVYNYYGMLKKQKNGITDSWAIRWYWSVFSNHGLVLYPPITMVKNIGFDGSGTHGWLKASQLFITETDLANNTINLPEDIYIKNDDLAAIKETFSSLRKEPLIWLKNIIKKVNDYLVLRFSNHI